MSITPEQLEETAAAPEPHEAQEPSQPSDDALVVEDLLVEEVSIDGMCGVY